MEKLAQNSDLVERLNSDFAKVVLPVTVLDGILACVGFIGNVLVLYVFSFKYHKCNYKYFVLFLALIDLTSCLTSIPGEMFTQRFWYTYPVPEICKAKSFFNVFTVGASALCLLLIAIDRYRKVCKRSGWQIRPKMAIFLCICSLVLAGIVAVPVSIYFGVQHYSVKYENVMVNVTSCDTDDSFKNTEYPLIYSSTISVIIALPMTVMAVLYFLICHEIRKGRHRERTTRSRTTNSADESVQLLSPSFGQEHPQIERKTLIMFIFSAVFVISTVIYRIMLSLTASEENILMNLSDGQRAVYLFFCRLYLIHHAINPFVYAFLDVHFQEALRDMICRIRN
ncbi:hypothetical protein CHS0354_000101 [Potamilus streckersoni]|uniref:G-protein coupled receptors family 1 profile domain-containing protein n=1 Tax=Potamilus streckersoni TaxID=2493646 RepID=A0AAE0TIQ0_9BIVA|nr:hypothetical protein CHS0354_000101 [Potamilus streckersoni]